MRYSEGLQHPKTPASYLLIFLLQLASLGLVGHLVLGCLFGPQLTQLLCDVSYGNAGVLALDPGPVVGAEHEEGRSGDREGWVKTRQTKNIFFVIFPGPWKGISYHKDYWN